MTNSERAKKLLRLARRQTERAGELDGVEVNTSEVLAAIDEVLADLEPEEE